MIYIFLLTHIKTRDMKHLKTVTIALLMASAIIAGCTKEEFSSEDSLVLSTQNNLTAPDLSKCKIRRIYQEHITPGILETALFSYNKAGNPYSVIYARSGTAYPNHFFFYDEKNRLIQYQQRWGLFYVHVYHYYRYNDKDQIIVDSTISSDANGSYPYETVSSIEYDALGRVIKETIVNTKNGDDPLKSTRRPTYTYDNRGNLGVIGWKSSSYDYKINPLRQSPVFQFIMRNYSRNNAAVQPRYNSIGLPLSMNPSNDMFFNAPITQKVIYDCQ